MRQLILLGLFMTSPLQSQENGHATVELWLAPPMVRDGSPTTIHAALRMVYENGWHGYWVNPGEGGMKTELRWKLPAGVKAGEVHFPIPKRETTGELVTYGYTGEVFFPVTLTVEGERKDHLPIELNVSWLACNDTKCSAGEATIKADLVTDVIVDAAKAATVKRAFDAVPMIDEKLRLEVKEADGWVELMFTGADHLHLEGAEIFPVSEQVLDPGSPITCEKSSRGLMARVKKNEYAAQSITKLEIVIVPRGLARAFSVDWKK